MSIFILISIWILIWPHHPHPMLPPRPLCGRPQHGVGVGWSDINIHIDITMNIDIHIIINMNIEYYIDYYTLLMPNFKEKVKIPKKLILLQFTNGCGMSMPVRIQCNIPKFDKYMVNTQKSKLVRSTKNGLRYYRDYIGLAIGLTEVSSGVSAACAGSSAIACRSQPAQGHSSAQQSHYNKLSKNILGKIRILLGNSI